MLSISELASMCVNVVAGSYVIIEYNSFGAAGHHPPEPVSNPRTAFSLPNVSSGGLLVITLGVMLPRLEQPV